MTQSRWCRRVGQAAVLAGLLTLELTSAPTSSGSTGRGDDSGLIVFQTERPAGDHTQTDLYTVTPDGSAPTRLTATPDLNEFGPVWSHDGDQIAFWRTPAPFGVGRLWVMSADGSDRRALTTGVDARDPSWNPDGSRIVYDRATDDLYSLRVSDGQDVQQLTSGPEFDFEPAWSPDGRRIAFTRGTATGDPGNIYVLRLNGLQLTRITRSAAYDHQVAWAPRGHRLVFERDFGDRSSIYTIRSKGTDLKRLTSGAHFDVGPAYSPDASRIAFGSDRAGFLDDLWVMDSDGTDAEQLTSLPFSEAFPDWRA